MVRRGVEKPYHLAVIIDFDNKLLKEVVAHESFHFATNLRLVSTQIDDPDQGARNIEARQGKADVFYIGDVVVVGTAPRTGALCGLLFQMQAQSSGVCAIDDPSTGSAVYNEPHWFRIVHPHLNKDFVEIHLERYGSEGLAASSGICVGCDLRAACCLRLSFHAVWGGDKPPAQNQKHSGLEPNRAAKYWHHPCSRLLQFFLLIAEAQLRQSPGFPTVLSPATSPVHSISRLSLVCAS